jgi:hypothetical protein
LIAVLALGCADPIGAGIKAANASRVFLAEGSAWLAAAHRRDRDAAVERARTPEEARALAAEVHAAYRPLWDAYDDARAAQLAAGAALEAAIAAEAAGLAPSLGRVTAALAEAARAYAALESALVAFRARVLQRASWERSARPDPVSVAGRPILVGGRR